MTLFSYKALDQKGKKFQGTIEASTKQEAKEKLRAQGVLVTELERGGAKGRKKFSRKDLLSFTLSLSQLVDSGIPIYDSLVMLEEQTRKEKINPLIASLCEEIKGGQSLSKSMESFPAVFDLRYRSMIQAGEASGSLGSILKKLTESLQKEDKIQGQIFSSLLYPMVLALLSLTVISILLLFVVPTMEELFEGKEVGLLTELVIGLSRFLRAYGAIFIALIFLLVALLYFQLKKPAAKERLQKIMLGLPLLGPLTVKAALCRFCRTLAILQQGGLSLTEALPIATGVLGNAPLEKAFSKAKTNVEQGSSFSFELQQIPYLPSFLSQMTAIGEDTGDLPGMLFKIADIYENETEKTLNRLVTLAQPLILIFMGIFIGLVMMAILLPLTDVGALNF